MTGAETGTDTGTGGRAERTAATGAETGTDSGTGGRAERTAATCADSGADGGAGSTEASGDDRRTSSGGMLGDSARISAAVALSRITGLVRVTVAAAVLGPTVLGDLFIAANVLPLTLYDVVAGSAISSILVPPLARLRGRDPVGSRRLAANALGVVVAALAVLVGVAVLLRGPIAGLLVGGVEPALADDALRVGGVLLALILPQLVAYGAIGVLVSIQHANGRFVLPSAAPIVENVGLLITIAVAGIRYGGGAEVDRAPLGLVLTLGIGSCLAVAAHVALQYAGARRAQGPIAIGLDWRDPEVRRLAAPARHSFGWSSVIALRHLGLIVAAAYAGAGGVQAFELAALLYFVPLALVGRPIASAALPRLATATSGQHLRGYLAAVRLAAWLAVPAGAALAFLSGPIAAAVATGRFDAGDGTTMVALSLAGLGVGAAAEALFEVGRQAVMARDRSADLRWANRLRAVTAVVGIPLVVAALDGPAVLLGLGLVVSAGDLAALAVTHRSLRRDPDWPVGTTPIRARLAAATVCAVAPPWLAAPFLEPLPDPLALLAVTAGAASLYGLAVFALADRGRLVWHPALALTSESAR